MSFFSIIVSIGTAEIISPHDAYHSSYRPALKPNERKDILRRDGEKKNRIKATNL